MSTQTSGLCLLAVGAALLWSAWALVVAGVLLIVVPEITRAVSQHRQIAEFRRAQAARTATSS